MSDGERSTKMKAGPRPDQAGLQESTPADGAEADVQHARRLFLRAGIFAPAVLASLTISQDALAQTNPSCAPSLCNPRRCGPDLCAPSRGCKPARR